MTNVELFFNTFIRDLKSPSKLFIRNYSFTLSGRFIAEFIQNIFSLLIYDCQHSVKRLNLILYEKLNKKN